MVAGCGAKLAKMILFVFNFLVWAVGIILIAVGGYVLARPDQYSSFFGSNSNSLTVVCGMVIGVGCLVFLLAFAGCCGAMKESACLLKIYIAVLLILLILEVVGGILAIVYRGEIEDILTKELTSQIKDYVYEADKEPGAIDLLQQGGKCCGSDNYTDWKGSKYQADTPGKFVPLSCCKDEKKDGCNDANKESTDIKTKNDIFNEGCIKSMVDAMQEYFLILGAVALSMVAAEILAMIFACCVISGINNNEYE